MPSLRVAVIADIHGNADALTAILSEIDRLAPDLIVNLGDHFSGPLAARETAELLGERDDIVTIRGNHDRYLVTHDPAEMSLSDAAALAELDRVHLDWISALPQTLQVADLFLCHGGPYDDEQYLLEQVTAAGTVVARDQAAIAADVSGIDAPVVLCAHTHTPRMLRLPTGQRIVNPGSVGCPAYDDDRPVPHIVQTGAPDARFAVIDRTGQDWQVALRSVPYDPSRMAMLAERKGRAGWARAVTTGWLSP